MFFSLKYFGFSVRARIPAPLTSKLCYSQNPSQGNVTNHTAQGLWGHILSSCRWLPPGNHYSVTPHLRKKPRKNSLQEVSDLPDVLYVPLYLLLYQQ